MKYSDYLKEEWVPALGCTEPASIAYAAASALELAKGEIVRVKLLVDPKIYKNCYAVGIPHSGHKTGIVWTVAIGANIKDVSLKLECFKAITPDILKDAESLIKSGKVEVDIDPGKTELYIDCTIEGKDGHGRAVIAGDHTNIVLLEKDGKAVSKKAAVHAVSKTELRGKIANMSLKEMIEFSRSITVADEERFKEGILLNRRIAEHGLTLFPERFINPPQKQLEPMSVSARLVCAGVYARMWGEDFPVMSLAGSGNKGIVSSVPLAVYGEEKKIPPKDLYGALALTCLVTSATTYHLGSLSAVCGCSNAAGIGLSAGLVVIDGGGEKEISLAINNMVGNVTGMICDGAKIGCALKTMTAVDAAFRAWSLAMSGVGIPPSDGIVGKNGRSSLENLGRIATRGMVSTDSEILKIMKEKMG